MIVMFQVQLQLQGFKVLNRRLLFVQRSTLSALLAKLHQWFFSVPLPCLALPCPIFSGPRPRVFAKFLARASRHPLRRSWVTHSSSLWFQAFTRLFISLFVFHALLKPQRIHTSLKTSAFRSLSSRSSTSIPLLSTRPGLAP